MPNAHQWIFMRCVLLHAAAKRRELHFDLWHLRRSHDWLFHVPPCQHASYLRHFFFSRLVFSASSFNSSVGCRVSTMKRKHLMMCDAVSNLKVDAYAEEHEKWAAGCNFGVDGKCLHRWLKQKEELARMSKSRKAFCVKACKFPELVVWKNFANWPSPMERLYLVISEKRNAALTQVYMVHGVLKQSVFNQYCI